MTDKSAIVTFTPPSTWDFSPNPVEMDSPGKVTLTPAPGSNWTFDSLAGLPSSEFKSDVKPQKITIDDKHSDKNNYPYSITIKTEDGTMYTTPSRAGGKQPPAIGGPPPIIINE